MHHNRPPRLDTTKTERPEPQYRYLGSMSPADREHTPIKSEVTATTDGKTALIRLFDPIDSWGGYWGVSAKEFVAVLDELGDDVKAIELHINSPGGDTFEGVTIYNALVSHEADVNVVVDGIAASAASVVAMAGDTITINTGGSVMVHDAWSLAIGDAAEMRTMATLLDHVSDNVASVYAARAGGKASDWRAVMVEETWYSAQEAVDAGLATKVGKNSAKKDDTKSSFDLSIFNYAGRENAPAPRLDINNRIPRDSLRNSSKHGQENKSMDLSPEVLQSLDLPADATQEQFESRVAQIIKGSLPENGGGESDPAVPVVDPEGDDTPADPAPVPPVPAPAAVEPAPAPPVEGEGVQASFQPPAGTVLMDAAQHAQFQNLVKEHDQMKADARKKERDDEIKSALKDGKFAPAQQKHYESLYDSNPTATKALIASLAKNSIPLDEIGHGGGSDQIVDDAYPMIGLSASERANIAKARQGA